MNLNTTDKSIQVKLGESVAVSQLDITASYVDLDVSNYVLGANDTVTDDETLVIAVDAPTSPNARTVKEMSITNVDTIPHVVFVYYVSGASQRVLQRVLLNVGSSLHYANGVWDPVSDRVSLVPLLTAASFKIYDRYILGGLDFSIASLVTVDASELTLVLGSLIPKDMLSLIALRVPALTTVGGDFNPNNLPSLNLLDVSALSTVGGSLDIVGLTALPSLDLPFLTSVGGNFTLNGLDSLASIDLSSLTRLGNILTASELSNLATVTLTSSLKEVGGDVTFANDALDEASVNSILVRLAALDGTAGTTSYDNHTVDLSGGTNTTPSATGLAAKATLEGRGNTVAVN